MFIASISGVVWNVRHVAWKVKHGIVYAKIIDTFQLITTVYKK